jgi:hypothetical protein
MTLFTSTQRHAASIIVALILIVGTAAGQQKNPLSHDVYDAWMRISGETVSPDGRWVMYTLEPQEGDARLILLNAEKNTYDTLARGTGAKFSEDSRFAVYTLKALWSDIRKARNAKKKGDDMPKDSLGILTLGGGSPVKIPRVKSFRLPEKGAGWVAYQLEKDSTDSAKKGKSSGKKEGADDGAKEGEKASTLVYRELASGKEHLFPSVREFALTKDGTKLLFLCAGGDSAARAGAFVFSAATGTVDTIARGAGSYKLPVWDDAGTQAAFVADRDTSKAKQRYFRLCLWRAGQDSAMAVADTSTPGMYPRWLISDNGPLSFSKDGTRLYAGTAPVPVPDDTSLIEEETAKLDVWSWTDPLLQTQQVKNLDDEKKRSYAAVFHIREKKFVQMGDTLLPVIVNGDEGNASFSLGMSDVPYRTQMSWEGTPFHDVFAVDQQTGTRARLLTGKRGSVSLSPGGRFAYWFDGRQRQWFAMPLSGGPVVQLSKGIPYPLYDEKNDVPDDPGAYGAAGWTARDSLLLFYDRFDVWGADPTGSRRAVCLTSGEGRKTDIRYRYVRLDPEERFLSPGNTMLLRMFHYGTKMNGFAMTTVGAVAPPRTLALTADDYGTPAKARTAESIIVTRGNFRDFPDLYRAGLDFAAPTRISDANPQQKNYLWGSVRLISWKGTDGKPLEGLLYTPEGFDPGKKYPMIVYYYERNSDLLHRYFPPAPSASTVNVSLYVSRGYIIFIPDIRYRIGYPGQSAYDCIVSGTKSLLAKGFIDKDRMGLQGQSWGGYQTAFIVTRTKMFRAGMAGAAVANMTSAYGGIRWESGVVREFQYEKQQSRIGATLWQRPDLYIENSPLFRADSVRTPLLMMNNDADGAVPWYQGIEFFSALRRLQRPVWMLTYNTEAHNLVQRKNRKDLSIRMLQFFDHYLMGAPAPAWMTAGLPATLKGKVLRYETPR